MVTVILCYHFYRKQAQIETTARSFYLIFIFVTFWQLARILYFTDAFVNYSFNTLAIIAILPCICAYFTIATSVYNV